MSSSTKFFAQVEEALGDARILDRDMVRDLLDLAKALEAALEDSCRTNLELELMDKNVASAADAVRTAIDSLGQAYTKQQSVDATQLEQVLEAKISQGRQLARRSP